MTPPPPAPAPELGARAPLGLKWKAILTMVAVLGVAHIAFTLFNFLQESGQYESRVSDEMAARPRAFDALLTQASQSLGELALRIAYAFANSTSASRETELAQTDSFGSLVAVEFFDARGQSLAAWDAPGFTRPTDTPQYPGAVSFVLGQEQPTTLVHCTRDCALYTFLPFFDRDGDKRVVGVGQPLTETLLAFQRLDGTDIGILHAGSPSDPDEAKQLRLWDLHLLALTNAPRLMPLLRTLDIPALDAPTELLQARSGGRDLRLFRVPLPRSSDPRSQLLFVLDETETLAAIRQQSLRSLSLNALTLALSATAVYLLLTPALRRLHDVTTALPLLAERRFADSREHVQRRDSRRRKDEIDNLREATLALSYRLEALDKAEAASAEKSRFLATMSHEIRTPMNGILGLLELLETGDLSDDQRDTVRIARSSGRTLLGVIDDILDFSKIEAAQIVIEEIPFALGEVLEGAADTLGPTARSKGLRLTVFVDPALPAQVIGDPHRLRQILFNLCSNAIKFTPSGRVQLRAQPATGAPAGRQRVRFHVIDSGIGLAPEARQVLFKPFSQADSTTTRRFGGSGLGLSIVRGLVTRMGGVVDFASAAGKGSDFWCELDFPVVDNPAAEELPGSLKGVDVRVELPDRLEAADLERYLEVAGAGFGEGPASLVLCESPRPGAAHACLDIRRGRQVLGNLYRPIRRGELRRRLREAAGLDAPTLKPLPKRDSARPVADGRWILVAEDHAVNQQVIQRQLTQLGYQSVLAADGLEALDKLQQQDFAVLLADLHMPNMDGLQLTEAIRASEAAAGGGTRLPIIALTAAALSGERDRCREAGMDGFLLKPAGLDRLRDVLGKFAPLAPLPEPDEPADAPPAPIDLEALSDMVGGDADFANELMTEFMRINVPFMGELQLQMSVAWDGRAVREKAHRLLGSSRTLAANTLADALASLEKHAEQDQASAALDVWPRVLEAFEDLSTFIRMRVG